MPFQSLTGDYFNIRNDISAEGADKFNFSVGDLTGRHYFSIVMTETFILPVDYLGTEHEFKARFERYGYTHRIAVLIDESTYVFEPDEEGSYRAVNAPEQPVASHAVNMNILRAVAEKLAKLSA